MFGLHFTTAHLNAPAEFEQAVMTLTLLQHIYLEILKDHPLLYLQRQLMWLRPVLEIKPQLNDFSMLVFPSS
ncbi:hypothetical protein Moror_15725 [Moniliophthora roreri MCA 2997]|uniref:Uncharacterized protein n=1 Tax=Moniliophthora roreri (strain MCA 2997) TaxID=1381753 RepID=V2WWV3_MONRO|nr:hypothetical protein Moror_15725 [Moniliophthora roreri MCA 2997]